MRKLPDFDQLWTRLSGAQPGFTRESLLGEINWGSLEWTEFLVEAMTHLPPEKKDLAVRKLFLELDFEKLHFNELTRILRELAENSQN